MSLTANPAARNSSQDEAWAKTRAANEVLPPKPVLVSNNPPGRLTADRKVVQEFYDTIFARCEGATGYMVLRATETHGKRRVIRNKWVRYPDDLIDSAEALATEVAALKGDERAVLAPPVCIFGDQVTGDGKRWSGESNVILAPTLTVDLDKHPASSLIQLWAVLGAPTLISASGGTWKGREEDEGEDKLHAYWRLYEPACSVEDRALLKQVRAMAAKLIDSDSSAAPLSHPMRLPGSYHTKGEPKLCRITPDGDPKRNIKLGWAFDELAQALEKAGKTWDGSRGFAEPGTGQFKTKEPLPFETLLDAANIIPNDDLEWEDWNTILMTFYDASHGSLDGYEAATIFSQKSKRYTAEGCEERWAHYQSSPPSKLSAGSLFHRIREVQPDYQRRPDLPAIWHEADAETPAPVAEQVATPTAMPVARQTLSAEAGIDDAAAPVLVREINRQHAFVMNKGRAFVANVAHGGEVTYSSKADFFNLLANRRVDDGKRKVSKGDLWWTDPHRAQFVNGIDFDPNGVAPGVLNIWRGFPALQAAPDAKCDLILRHIREVICSGVERDYQYLIKWLAHILQKPGEKPGVAVVLRGKKGTGKDTLGEYMSEILKHLYIMAADQTLVTGAFNHHMTGKLLLHVQEAIWAGNKQAESALKSMITAPEMLAHPKGIDAFMVKSFMRVMMTSNEDWVVPASEDERRFFVLNVSDERMQSAAWFDPIRAEMRSGGPAAFAQYLRAIDLTGFDVRHPHKTEALREQQRASLSDFALFWSELIEDSGTIPGENGGSWEVEHARVKLDDLVRRYDDWRKHRKYSKHVSREEAGRLLKDYTQGEVQAAQTTIDGSRVAVRVLPPAGRCRVLWGQRCAD